VVTHDLASARNGVRRLSHSSHWKKAWQLIQSRKPRRRLIQRPAELELVLDSKFGRGWRRLGCFFGFGFSVAGAGAEMTRP